MISTQDDRGPSLALDETQSVNYGIDPTARGIGGSSADNSDATADSIIAVRRAGLSDVHLAGVEVNQRQEKRRDRVLAAPLGIV